MHPILVPENRIVVLVNIYLYTHIYLYIVVC